MSEEDFRVIGAGLSRTGTLSLMYALEILLEGKCYHGLKAAQHEREWCEIMDGKYTDEEFKDFLFSCGYVAAVDIPFYLYHQRALKIFPNAKVVLTTRDPESWVKSVESSLMLLAHPSYLPVFLFPGILMNHFSYKEDDDFLRHWTIKMLMSLYRNKELRAPGDNIRNGTGLNFFKNWEKQVESNVPKEKLLKFDVKEGWEPLCKFLDLPIPDVPFPRVNSSQEMVASLYRLRRRAWGLLGTFAIVPIFAYLMYSKICSFF